MRKAKGKRQRAKGKNKFLLFTFYFCFYLFVFAVNLSAQTGGAFQIENSAVASGGGKISGGSSSSSFTLDSTAGQTLAGGQLQGSQFFLQNGFWTFSFAPTAASVSVSGRIMTFDGRGIQNARVTLTSLSGETKFSLTGSFGFYRFDNVEVGGTYILTVISKRFAFTTPTQIITVSEELHNLDFQAMEQ